MVAGGNIGNMLLDTICCLTPNKCGDSTLAIIKGEELDRRHYMVSDVKRGLKGNVLTLLMRVVLRSASLASWEWSCWTSTSRSVSTSVSSGFSKSWMSTSSAARHECHTSSSSHTSWAHNHMSWFIGELSFIQSWHCTAGVILKLKTGNCYKNVRTRSKLIQINRNRKWRFEESFDFQLQVLNANTQNPSVGMRGMFSRQNWIVLPYFVFFHSEVLQMGWLVGKPAHILKEAATPAPCFLFSLPIEGWPRLPPSFCSFWQDLQAGVICK